MHKNEKDKYRNDIFEARYWAGRMMEKRNFIWGRWEELFTVHNDLLKWADRIMKNYKELEAEHDELKIRLNAAEAGSLEQAEEYMELKEKLDIATEALEWVHKKVYPLNPDMATLENYIERIKA